MTWRLVFSSLWRERRRRGIAVLNVSLAAALATALLNLSLDVGDKMNRELRGFGANLVVLPRSGDGPLLSGVEYNPLARRDGVPLASLPKIKEIFWQHNIVSFAPLLTTRGRAGDDGKELVEIAGTWFDRAYPVSTDQGFRAGLARVHPSWRISGRWPLDSANPPQALLGFDVARRLGLSPGGEVRVAGEGGATERFIVAGVVRTGAEEDRRAFVPLASAQRLAGRDGVADQVLLSALTMPDNDLAVRARKGEESLSSREYDVWYCSPFVDSVARQIEEVIPGARVKPIRQVTESEGVVVRKIQLLMAVVTAVALLCSALGAFSLARTMVVERRREIGLGKALGAGSGRVVLLFLAETAVIGLAGGLLGIGLGIAVCEGISRQLFGSWASVNLGVVPAVGALSVLVNLAGSFLPARAILRVEPSITLAGQ